MMNLKQSQKCEYVISVYELDDDGSFKCPQCGICISPDDETADNYEIIDPKVDDNDRLSAVVFKCNRCGCTITVTGFSELFCE